MRIHPHRHTSQKATGETVPTTLQKHPPPPQQHPPPSTTTNMMNHPYPPEEMVLAPHRRVVAPSSSSTQNQTTTATATQPQSQLLPHPAQQQQHPNTQQHALSIPQSSQDVEYPGYRPHRHYTQPHPPPPQYTPHHPPQPPQPHPHLNHHHHHHPQQQQHHQHPQHSHRQLSSAQPPPPQQNQQQQHSVHPHRQPPPNNPPPPPTQQPPQPPPPPPSHYQPPPSSLYNTLTQYTPHPNPPQPQAQSYQTAAYPPQPRRTSSLDSHSHNPSTSTSGGGGPTSILPAGAGGGGGGGGGLPAVSHSHSQKSTIDSSASSPGRRRVQSQRPIVKLSLSLIDTYRRINEVYYEERRARRNTAGRKTDDPLAASGGTQPHPTPPQTSSSAGAGILTQQQPTPPRPSIPDEYLPPTPTRHPPTTQSLPSHYHPQPPPPQPPPPPPQSLPQRNTHERGPGPNNHGWDDEHYDYIFTQGESFGRYVLQERIGKGSFGQVVKAWDNVLQVDVAIKIIKSKKPFQMQAGTEINLLTHLKDRDREDKNNIVRLLAHFMHKNHQCLVFEMLSLNLYELLKNTQFKGVSLKLIRKFSKQILEALKFLARKDVDVIHCDLKPENILLRHPNKSGVKVIDFGSSCRSTKRTFFYIQSRFYRSPEVMLGLPYGVPIDMWSLGCILVEMLTGDPLFSGSDQFDQMQKIVKVLGMLPDSMLEQSSDERKLQFFERNPTTRRWCLKTRDGSETVTPSTNPIQSLGEVIDGDPPSQNSTLNTMFIDLIHRMLTYRPEERITPEEAMQHPFIVATQERALTAEQQVASSTPRNGYSPLRQRPDP